MPIPTRKEIFEHFKLMGEGRYEEFFTMIDDQVDWTIMGTSPMSQTFADLEDFRQKTLARLRKILKDPGLMIKVKNVIGGGPEQEWASVELGAEAQCIDGRYSVYLGARRLVHESFCRPTLQHDL